jgi:cbb3-type cytochrome oxidase subunit 3
MGCAGLGGVGVLPGGPELGPVTVLHATSKPTMPVTLARVSLCCQAGVDEFVKERWDMVLLLLEALVALLILLGIVWWTMFSGRKKGEPERENSENNDKNSH